MPTDEQNELQELLRTLSENQLRFVSARMNTGTDKEAAQRCDLNPDSIYNWPNKADVNRCVQLARLDGINVAREELRRGASEAVQALIGELKGKRAIDAAVAILDRVGLEAGQNVNVGANDKALALFAALARIRENSGETEDDGDDDPDAE